MPSKWISVEKEMPDRFELVTVVVMHTYKTRPPQSIIMPAYRGAREWFHAWDNGDDEEDRLITGKVVAWRELEWPYDRFIRKGGLKWRTI